MFIQKGKIRFSKKEIWDLDTHLAKIIYTGLVQFKQSKRYGTPSPFLAESTVEHPLGTTTEETKQAWEDTLDQMIYAFSVSSFNFIYKKRGSIKKPLKITTTIRLIK